jgi:DNA-binding GntR family transcriptional regulator
MQSDEETLEYRSRTRLVDEVAQVLRERIYAGRYGAGEPLRQEHLAADLRVSRTPLREAIRVLEREGLLHSEPGRGVRVVTADLATLLDAYALREVVDGLAARLAAERAGEEDVARLRELVREQRATLDPFDPGAYTLSNVSFHATVTELAANAFLRGELPLMRLTSQVFTPVDLIGADHARLAVDQHAAIVQAIAAGDGPEAELRARAHIRSTITRLQGGER